MTPDEQIHRAHPAYADLVCRYRAGRDAWAASPAMREAALLLGIDERSYCDAHMVNVCWTGSSTVIAPLTRTHLDMAFADAAVRDRLPVGYPPLADADVPFDAGRIAGDERRNTMVTKSRKA